MKYINELVRFSFLNNNCSFRLWPFWLNLNETKEYGKLPFISLFLVWINKPKPRFMWAIYFPPFGRYTKGFYRYSEGRFVKISYKQCVECNEWDYFGYAQTKCYDCFVKDDHS